MRIQCQYTIPVDILLRTPGYENATEPLVLTRIISLSEPRRPSCFLPDEFFNLPGLTLPPAADQEPCARSSSSVEGTARAQLLPSIFERSEFCS